MKRYWPLLAGAAASISALYWIVRSNTTSGNIVEKRGSKVEYSRSNELSLPHRDSSGAKPLKLSELSNILSVEDIDVEGKRVVLRTDYNVLIDSNGYIEDTARIDRSIPTIEYLLKNKVHCIVILTHIGRPTGDFNRSLFSTEPLIPYLRSQLPPGTPISFFRDCVGHGNRRATFNCEPGTVFLCENVRFHVEEVGSGIINGKRVNADVNEIREFGRKMARMGDIYVLEAYGAAHRPHTSIVNVKTRGLRVAGLNMAKELRAFGILLSRALLSAQRKKKQKSRA